jgi:hypothetical protein
VLNTAVSTATPESSSGIARILNNRGGRPLLLNAASFSEEKPLLELGAEQVWAAYEANVHGPLDMVEGFNKQPGDKPKVRATPPFLCRVLKDIVNG